MGKKLHIEDLEKRAAYWRLVIDILKLTHKRRFPGRHFGRDIELLFVYGAAIVALSKDNAVHATDIVRLLGIPRETARRKLNRLVELDLLQREDRAYHPAKMAQSLWAPLGETRVFEIASIIMREHAAVARQAQPYRRRA